MFIAVNYLIHIFNEIFKNIKTLNTNNSINIINNI